MKNSLPIIWLPLFLALLFYIVCIFHSYSELCFPPYALLLHCSNTIHHGCIDLGGLFKVTAAYEKSVSISVYSNNDVLLNLQSRTEKRVLIISSKMPEVCVAGTQMENMVFEIVKSDGVGDDTIHQAEKSGQLHMLTIMASSSSMEESLRYTFKHGCCTVPAIFVPEVEESFNFVAAHSSHPELHLNVNIGPAFTETYHYL